MNKNEDEIFPNPPDRVAEHRKYYASYSRQQLIQEMHKWLSHAAQHIAAKQLLDEMDKTDSDNKHEETLKAAKGANKWAKWAVIVGVLSFLAFVGDFAYRYFYSKDESKKHTEEQVSKPTGQSSTKETVSPPIVSTRKPQSKQESIKK